MVRSVLHIAALVISMALSSSAFAQSDADTARANELVREAVAAFQEDDFVTAATKFKEAHEFVPQPSLKLNEMVAWYKGDRCGEAEAVAEWVQTQEFELTEQDRKDVDRVTSDCACGRAEQAFESGDIDEAERILNSIETEDDDVRLEIATLRGKIEERRKSMATDGADETAKVDQSADVSPPPEWAKWAGFGLIGGGGAGLVALLIKFVIERRQLAGWNDYFEQQHGCTYSKGAFTGSDCKAQEARGDEKFGEFESTIKLANTTTVVLAIASAAGLAVGGGLVGYYFLQKSAYEESLATKQTMLLVPTFGPNSAGMTFQLRF